MRTSSRVLTRLAYAKAAAPRWWGTLRPLSLLLLCFFGSPRSRALSSSSLPRSRGVKGPRSCAKTSVKWAETADISDGLRLESGQRRHFYCSPEFSFTENDQRSITVLESCSFLCNWTLPRMRGEIAIVCKFTKFWEKRNVDWSRDAFKGKPRLTANIYCYDGSCLQWRWNGTSLFIFRYTFPNVRWA